MDNWQDINNVYEPCRYPLIKGAVVKLNVAIVGDFESFEKNIFGIKSLLTYWSYPTSNGDVTPFKLLQYERNSNSFCADLRLVKKSHEVDELRLLCQDIIDVLNIHNLR